MLEIKIKTDIRVCELDDGTYIMSKASIVNRIRKETNPKNTKTKLTPYAVQKQLSKKYSIPENTIKSALSEKNERMPNIEIIKAIHEEYGIPYEELAVGESKENSDLKNVTLTHYLETFCPYDDKDCPGYDCIIKFTTAENRKNLRERMRKRLNNN